MSVVVGYVPTQTGYAAVTEAVREARTLDAPVIVVNVVGQVGFQAPTAASERDLDAVTSRLAREGVAHSIRQVTHDGDETAVPGVLLNLAREENAALIVLGLGPRSRLARRLLGSTAQDIVLGAPCPVLVVPNVDQPPAEPLGPLPWPAEEITEP